MDRGATSFPSHERGTIASLAIGLILAATATFLAWECQSLFTGEGVSAEVQASLHAITAAEPNVSRVNEILAMLLGPMMFWQRKPRLRKPPQAEEIEQAVTRIEQRIKKAHPEIPNEMRRKTSFRHVARNAHAMPA